MPAVSGFKPYGGKATQSKAQGVYLFYEEYESLRLSDYEKHTQCESAAIMGVSRPTFTRIYQSAREKIAKAFVEGLRIIIEGGKVQLDGDWYVCGHCSALFTAEGQTPSVCPLCGSTSVSSYVLGEPAAQTEPAVTPTVYDGLRLAEPSRGSSSACTRRPGCRRKSCRPQADTEKFSDGQ